MSQIIQLPYFHEEYWIFFENIKLKLIFLQVLSFSIESLNLSQRCQDFSKLFGTLLLSDNK